MPVLTGPVGAEGRFNPDGYVAITRANAVAGVQSIVPEAAQFSLEEVAEQAAGAARIMQLHPMGRVEHVLAIAARAAAAGYEALCVTCDCPTSGWRERNLHNRFVMDLDDLAGNFHPGSPVTPQEVFGQLFDRDEPVWTWEQLAEAMAAAGMPWVAKASSPATTRSPPPTPEPPRSWSRTMAAASSTARPPRSISCRVQREAADLGQALRVAGQLAGDVHRTAVLPADRRTERPSRRAVPPQRRLALVSEPDRPDRDPRGVERDPAGREHGVQQLLRVLLDRPPAAARRETAACPCPSASPPGPTTSAFVDAVP